MRSRASRSARSAARTSLCQALDLFGAGNERCQIEAEGLIDLSPLPFAGVALAVGAVAAHHEAGVDQSRRCGRRRVAGAMP